MASRLEENYANRAQSRVFRTAPRTPKPAQTSASITSGLNRGAAAGAAQDTSNAARGASRTSRAAGAARGAGQRASRAASSITSRIPGSKALGRVSLYAGKVAAPVMAGEAALATVNTPLQESAKLADLEPYTPQEGDSMLTSGLGHAKNAYIRGLTGAYNLAENTGAIDAVDMIPGVDMPRMQGGRYIPADQYDELNLGDIASGVNSVYRRMAGYDQPQQQATPVQQVAASGQQPTATNPRPDSAARTRNYGNTTVRETRQTNGNRRFEQAPQDPNAPQAQPSISTYNGADATGQYQRATAIRRETQDMQDRRRDAMSARRQQENERMYANQASSDRNRILDRVADMVDSPNPQDRQQGIEALTNLRGVAPAERGDLREQVSAGQPTAAQQEVARIDAESKRLNLTQAQRQQAMQQHIQQLAQTDPQAAQSLTDAYLAMTGQAGDRYVQGQEAIMYDANGDPLMEPQKVDVTYDTRTGRQYGGTGGQSAGRGGQGRLSKAEWVKIAKSDPRNQGMSDSDLERFYDTRYGS